MAFSWREEVRVAHELPQMIAGSTEPGNDPLWVKTQKRVQRDTPVM